MNIVIENCYFNVGNVTMKQAIGIPMGSDSNGIRIPLLSLKLQIWRLLRARSSLTLRQTIECRFTVNLVRDIIIIYNPNGNWPNIILGKSCFIFLGRKTHAITYFFWQNQGKTFPLKKALHCWSLRYKWW